MNKALAVRGEKVLCLGERHECEFLLSKEFQPIDEKQELFLEMIKEGIGYNKASRAEKIVNDYGQAIVEGNEINKKKVVVTYEGVSKLRKTNDSSNDKEALLRYNIDKPFFI